MGELVERFECLSVSSSGGNSARRHAGAAAPQAAPATAGCHTTELTRFMLEEAPQPGTSSSSSRASGALSLAASGSVSLAHFLGGAPASASTSRSSSMPRCVRRVGSTQLVLADGEASPTVANAEAGGDGAAVPAAAEPAAPPVQRRLSEIQSGHYISLDKLQSQCGDFQGGWCSGMQQLRADSCLPVPAGALPKARTPCSPAQPLPPVPLQRRPATC